MSNLELIERLCGLLDEAQQIVREQAKLLAMHGISTDDGGMEAARTKLLEQIEKIV